MPQGAETAGLDFIGSMLPFWPLLATIAIGIMLATGRMKALADKAVVLGVLLSAISAVYLFMSIGGYPQQQVEDWSSGQAATALAEQGHGEESESGQHAARGLKSTTHTLMRWISLGDSQWVNLTFFIDPLTGVMLVTVTVVALMVVIYSIGYMRDHHGHKVEGYERFFAWLGLFVFSMCMLVVAGNFVLLYLGWEAVGLCSYLLIGFHYKRPAAAAAAKKAFLVNRIGDFGFALGIFCLYMFIHPHVVEAALGENALDYSTVFKYAALLTTNEATIVSLLLLCGALGKSAQFPLHVWLPDAMEGPSPVSALIHAATMVTAGVYMVARCGPIFAQSPLAMNVICVIGAFTALFAATMAMTQFDMKRILAYSTISQLAYMFVGLGAGAPDSAVFHLFTHAFFKALLFLCAGSVMHAMGDVIDLRKFGGLRKVLPKTYWLTLVGCLALAGFPLLSGFWSKDEIIHAALEKNTLLGLVMIVTAALTAYYTFRMFFLCFHGPKRLPLEAGEHPHDAPPAMIGPLAFLAIGAVLAGLVGVTFHASDSAFLGVMSAHGPWHAWLSGSTIIATVEHAEGVPWLMYISGAIALAGIWLAWIRFGDAPRLDPDEAALGGAWKLFNAKYYVDEINDRIFVRPLHRLGSLCFATDKNLVDGLVNLCGLVPVGFGALARVLQAGSLQTYGLGMVVGIAFLLVWWMASAGGIF